MTNPDIRPGLLVRYRASLDPAGAGREVSRINDGHVVVVFPGTENTANRVPESEFWKIFKVVEKSDEPESDDGGSPSIEAAIAAEPAPVTLAAPGFYTVVEHDGRLIVESFTSSTVLESDAEDGGAKPMPGVWVTSHGILGDHTGVVVTSIHEDELDARRALDTEQTRPRVTYVEFGAPVQDIITETHSIR